jgi:60 kDa SS-A/Ro ribonucleoprotein
MAKALRNYANREIPVTEQASPLQVANNGGGFSFAISDKVRLERFLILGTDSGTYYVNEMDLTKQNVNFIIDLIKKDENLVRGTAVEISKTGRAYRNDAAVFVMALLLVHGRNKALTVSAIPDVVRTATHVYDLAGFISAFGGWGRAKRDAVNSWFASKSADELAYQAVKYRQRNGWTLRDVMRKTHPEGVNPLVGNFILKGEIAQHEGAEILQGFKAMQSATSVTQVLKVLDNYRNLPWETIPTQYLNDPKVWKKLFENGQLRGQALIRQITRMAKLGMFDDMGFARKIADAMRDEEMIRRTRLHPMQYLNGYVVYTEGQIPRGSGGGYWGGVSRQKSWNTSGIIQDALDDGFGLAFGNIEPSGKNIMISVDVSGSMSWTAAGTSNFTCAQAAGAMALVTARVEPQYTVNGFSGDLVNLNLTARDSIESAFRKVKKNNFGSTNPSAPLKKAIRDRIPVDTFVIITDNEVNSGSHVHLDLKEYRRKTGIKARMVVMGMAANNFSLADPLDGGMLDVLGFDSNTPKVVSDFSAGRI